MSPRRILLASALAVLTAAGCGAVTPADLVASVEGAELTEQQFDEYARELAGVDDATEVDGQLGRQVVGMFLGVELLRADLAAMGATLPPMSEGVDGFTAVQNDFQLMVQTWAALPPETMVDEQMIALYESGPEASGLACVSHILVETEEEAEEAAGQLAGGADFAELAGAISIDTQSAAAGGSVGCYPTLEFTTRFISEFVDAALAAEVGVPTDPFESQFGWHIVQLAPIEELDATSVGQLRLETFEDRYEIVVDPRIGQWDPSAILLPTV